MHRPLPCRFLACCILLTLSPVAHAYEWTGAAGAGFTTAGSWKNSTVPKPNTVNNGDLVLSNETEPALEYTAAEGTSVFNCNEFKIGNSHKPAGSLIVSGGELTINSMQSPIIGQNNGKTSKLTITGGKLTVNNQANTPDREKYFRIGNALYGTIGILEVSGGELVITSPGVGTNPGFVIASGPASGWVHLTGGSLRITNANGTAFQAVNDNGVGILTIGQGKGKFIQTASKKIDFAASRNGVESYIDFEAGTDGLLSLAGATQADFEAWVVAGKIRLESQVTTPDRFAYASVDGQGIYRLTTAKD